MQEGSSHHHLQRLEPDEQEPASGHDQPVLFYDGSPMHDYLASVAPDEVLLQNHITQASSSRDAALSETSEASERVVTMTGQRSTPSRRKVRHQIPCYLIHVNARHLLTRFASLLLSLLASEYPFHRIPENPISSYNNTFTNHHLGSLCLPVLIHLV